MVPSLSNPDTLAVVSDDYLRYIIEQGREGTSMIPWAPGSNGNLHADEIERREPALHHEIGAGRDTRIAQTALYDMD